MSISFGRRMDAVISFDKPPPGKIKSRRRAVDRCRESHRPSDGRPFGPADWCVVIETDRLRLAPLTRSDAAALFPVLDDRALHRHTGGEPLDEPALQARFARLEQGEPADHGEVWANWIVRLRDTDEAIGYVQATIAADGADLAWVIGSRWQANGYASEAARAMATWLRGAGVDSLSAHIHPDNEPSGRVAARAGLRRTGRLDDDGEVVWADRPVDARSCRDRR
jgi:RimJ/RimL family protein N-acetyltransferase